MTVADKMRATFDGSFALPATVPSTTEVDLLAIRVAGEPYALRVGELTGVLADRTITPAPSRVPALLGLTGVRSAIVPVFDLAALLGHPRAPLGRWLAMRDQMGFAFEALEGHVRVETAAISDEVLRFDGQLRSIIRLASVIATLGLKEK